MSSPRYNANTTSDAPTRVVSSPQQRILTKTVLRRNHNNQMLHLLRICSVHRTFSLTTRHQVFSSLLCSVFHDAAVAELPRSPFRVQARQSIRTQLDHLGRLTQHAHRRLRISRTIYLRCGPRQPCTPPAEENRWWGPNLSAGLSQHRIQLGLSS